MCKINSGIFSTDKNIEIKENDIVVSSGINLPVKMLCGWDLGGEWSITGIVRKNAKNKWRIDPNINGIVNQPWYKLNPENKDKLIIKNIKK